MTAQELIEHLQSLNKPNAEIEIEYYNSGEGDDVWAGIDKDRIRFSEGDDDCEPVVTDKIIISI